MHPELTQCCQVNLGFPGASGGKRINLGSEDPLEKEWLPTPVFLPGESHGQRSLVGCSPWGRKESDTTERITFSLLSRLTAHPITHTHRIRKMRSQWSRAGC